MDVSIIIVNWNTRELLHRCLISIETNRGDLSLEIIVVDNASSDGSAQMVGEEFAQVQLIASRENLGYTGGNNLGADKAKGRYLLVLNPDTEIIGDALRQMVSYLDEHPAVGVVGPQLCYPDGSIQPTRRRFPRLTTTLFQSPIGWRWFRNNKFIQDHHMADSPDDKIQAVDWLVGAALMIRREAWQEVGPFDTQFFMYSDEVDWCYRCQSMGWEIHYFPQAQFIHYEKAASRQVAVKSLAHFHRGKILYFRKHVGLGQATVLHVFLLMNYAWLLAEETARWIIGRRSAARQQNIKDYWQTLRSGLK